ncbi:MAG: MmgE/PrpD family protein [Bacillota bacterium]|nr:MmgE/PrpD family protein [Bacillota bacterium]
MTESLSVAIARYVTGVKLERVPEEVVRAAYRAVLDWAGSVLRGGRELPAVLAAGLVERWQGAPVATVLPTWRRTSPPWAALVNGMAAHIVEMDDLHRASTFHPAAPIISAALAAAEDVGATAKEFLEAVIVGYDVGIRIAEAVNPSHYRFWHNTGTCGTFGAAAAVAKLLKLSEEQIVHALGSAGTQAAALWEFMRDGAMSKPLHTGKAAFNGLLSAYLAQGGFTGATRILEGEQGFFRAMAENADPSKVTDGLGEHFKIVENDFKLHACCGHTHTAIDLAIEAARELGVPAEQVRRITVETYRDAVQVAGKTDPRTVYEAKFSIPYCVAIGWIRGRAFLDEFTPELVADPQVRALLGRVRLQVTDEMNARYPQAWPARLTVETADGRVWTKEADHPLGSWRNPVPDTGLWEKFDVLAAGGTLDPDKVALVKEFIRSLEQPADAPLAIGRAA